MLTPQKNWKKYLQNYLLIQQILRDSLLYVGQDS